MKKDFYEGVGKSENLLHYIVEEENVQLSILQKLFSELEIF